MRTIAQLLAAVALLGGAALFVLAIQTPGKYLMLAKSAVQVSQVYSEATFYGVMAIAAFAAGILLAVSSLARSE